MSSKKFDDTVEELATNYVHVSTTSACFYVCPSEDRGNEVIRGNDCINSIFVIS